MLSRRLRRPKVIENIGLRPPQWQQRLVSITTTGKTPGERVDETSQRPGGTAPDVVEHLSSDRATTSKSIAQSDDERSTRSRHLVRAILRECTYLPDAFARHWMSQHALSRFRSYDFKAWKHRNDSDYENRLRAKEKEARSWVTYLRRANEGERKCLMRVLFMAYGRIGKRRHELLMPLVAKKDHEKSEKILSEQAHNDNAVELNAEDDRLSSAHKSDIAPNTTTEKKHGQPDKLDKSSTLKIEPELTPQLRALLLSQIQQSPPSIVRTQLRRITREIPALNAWLRPMPQRRVRNMRKKHLLEVLDRALPPVPTDDWNHLLALASGRETIAPPVTRRKLAKTCLLDKASDKGAPWSENAALETVLLYGKPPTKVLRRRDGHAITPRFMQRLYAQVLSQCSYMEWHKESNKWIVVWGDGALRQLQQPEIRVTP